MDLNTMLEAAARKYPDKDAVIAGDEHITYAELLEASRRAATVFMDGGVEKGDTVAIMTVNEPAFIIGMFGLWRAGAALVPINHKFQAREVEYTLRHCGATLALVSPALEETAKRGAPKVTWWTTPTFRQKVNEARPSEGRPVRENDLAQVLYTSGTTSAPKGCEHTHRSITTIAPLICSTIPFHRDDRMLIGMPIWHSAPLNDWTIPMLFLGATVVLMEEYNPIQFLEIVEKERITTFFGAPIAFLAPLQVTKAKGLDFSSYDLSSANKWIYGGAPLGEKSARMLMEAYGTDQFYQVYGMSEMGPVGTALYPREQLKKAGSIGRGGMPGVDLQVVDKQGHTVKAGKSGEIWMRTDTRMRGYRNDKTRTQEAFVGDWYRTGDVARIDEDGFLYIVDRLKDIVVVGGENVYSQEVEEALRPHSDIEDVAIIGRPDEDWGEQIVAVITPRKGTAPTLDDVRNYLSDKLARYKLPREVILQDQMPRNPSGKLQKHILRKKLLS